MLNAGGAKDIYFIVNIRPDTTQTDFGEVCRLTYKNRIN